VVRLDHGRLVDDGVASEVIDAYAGVAWAGGVDDAVGGVRLLPLELPQRKVAVGSVLVAEGTLVVEDPAPHARIEAAFRVTPGDRTAQFSRTDRVMMSFLVHTVEPVGGATAQPGVYRYRLEIPCRAISGAFDLVVSVVDDLHERVLAECWQSILIGSPNPYGLPHPVMSFDWDVERLDDPAEVGG